MKKGDDDTLYYDDGTSVPLSPNVYTLEFGKYKGICLADVDDVGYLSWLQGSAIEKKDWFLEKVTTMRLYELQD